MIKHFSASSALLEIFLNYKLSAGISFAFHTKLPPRFYIH